jgi:hypothetical protein
MIQREFPAADPWYLVVANGDTRVAPGRAPRPTVTIRCRFEDWADLAGGRRSGVQLAARGRICPDGRPALALERAPDVPALRAPRRAVSGVHRRFGERSRREFHGYMARELVIISGFLERIRPRRVQSHRP